MRSTKRLLALVLAVVMLVSTCVIGNASATYSKLTSVDMDGAVYTKLSVTGTSKTVNAHVVTFDPMDNVIPMAYSGAAGKAMTLDQHVAAAIAEGYDVLGAVNGGFFEMTEGANDPLGTVISTGRLLFYHRLESTREELTTFGIDGTANYVYSDLKFTFAFDGADVSDSNALGLFNMDYTIIVNKVKNIAPLIHYYDSKAGDLSYTSQSGVEVLCEVIGNTEPAIGETLKGKVVSVDKNSHYGKLTSTGIADNQFVIFTNNDGQFVNNVSGLSKGDTVDLTIEETNADARPYMENAFSAIHSTLWLANTNSGTYEDLTDPEDAFIKHDCHNYGRGWTVFGWDKSTGKYGFLVSEEPTWGNGIDLADATDVLHDMTGATEIIRLDGGGSSVMYADGKMVYTNQERTVPDCIIIIRLPEKYNLKKTLTEAEEIYVGDLSAEASAYLVQAYESAFAVYNNSNSDDAAYKTANTNLQNAIAYVKNANNFVGKAKLTESYFLFANDIDNRVEPGYASVFTTTFNSGVITHDKAGIGLCYNLICKSVGGNKYKVVKQINLPGTEAADIVLESDQILVSVSKSNEVTGSILNAETAQRCVPGTVLTFNGFFPDSDRVSAGAYVLCDIPDSTDEPVFTNVPKSGNVATYGEYTLSQLYRQGGADVSWDWDETKPITYPDENGSTLTDGKFATTVGYGDAAWIGFHSKAPDYSVAGYHSITFAFDETVGIKTVNIYVGTSDVGNGVNAPDSIEVFSSDDGNTWESVTTVVPTNVPTDTVSAAEKVSITVDRNTKNLQLRLKKDAWVFVSEVEVMAGDVADHVCTPDGGWKTDEMNHWHICSCGKKVDNEAHSGEWKTVKEAEIGVEGKKEQRCTVCDYLMAEKTIPALDNDEPIGLRGDVNENGEIDSRDYVQLKRAYFKTAVLNEIAEKLADVNNNGEIDSRDYVQLKRVYFKTAVIADDIMYVY